MFCDIAFDVPCLHLCNTSGIIFIDNGGWLLVFCNVMNKLRKRMDTAVAFTQEYSEISYPLRNVSTLPTGSGSSTDTYTGVGGAGQRELPKI